MSNVAANSKRNAAAYEQRTYTVDEIAKILGIGRTSAYNLVRSRHFKTVRIGTSIRISRQSFDEWLDKQDVNQK